MWISARLTIAHQSWAKVRESPHLGQSSHRQSVVRPKLLAQHLAWMHWAPLQQPPIRNTHDLFRAARGHLQRGRQERRHRGGERDLAAQELVGEEHVGEDLRDGTDLEDGVRVDGGGGAEVRAADGDVAFAGAPRRASSDTGARRDWCRANGRGSPCCSSLLAPSMLCWRGCIGGRGSRHRFIRISLEDGW